MVKAGQEQRKPDYMADAGTGMATAKPWVTIVGPEMTIDEPCLMTVGLEMTSVRPGIALAVPRMAIVESGIEKSNGNFMDIIRFHI